MCGPNQHRKQILNQHWVDVSCLLWSLRYESPQERNPSEKRKKENRYSSYSLFIVTKCCTPTHKTQDVDSTYRVTWKITFTSSHARLAAPDVAVSSLAVGKMLPLHDSLENNVTKWPLWFVYNTKYAVFGQVCYSTSDKWNSGSVCQTTRSANHRRYSIVIKIKGWNTILRPSFSTCDNLYVEIFWKKKSWYWANIIFTPFYFM